MFCQKHQLKIALLRIKNIASLKHRIVKKTEHRPPLAAGEDGQADGEKT